MSEKPWKEPEMPIHRNLDDDMDLLRTRLLDMFDLVDEQVAGALNALLEKNDELAEEVRRRDDEVDALELEVDRHAERILALYQPVASELRFLIVAVKVNTDLERIGDHCKNIAKKTMDIREHSGALAVTRFDDMGDAARKMLRDVQDAFTNRDRRLAERVMRQDSAVDRIHKENFKALIALGRENPESIESVAHAISVSKAIERISDHAKNVAQSVIFLVEAVDVRHPGVQGE